MADNLLPFEAEITKITQETGTNLNIKTFRVKIIDPEIRNKFSFIPGQFLETTVYGIGEAPFGFASSPTEADYFEFSVKETGLVTEALHNLNIGDQIGIRGPFGNGFPVNELKGKNIVFIGGGIGLAPLRSLINYVLAEQNREEYGRIQMLHAFRSPEDTLYQIDYPFWEHSPDTVVKYTIDRSCAGWEYCVGFPHTLLATELECTLPDSKFVTCGPPIMIKFVTEELRELGIKPIDIITTLEMKMSCGLGRCGRCNIGHQYVCKDGPVFTLAELDQMPAEF